MTSKRRYFDTFDALRFLAFFAVFLSHAPSRDIPVLGFISQSGGVGVSFFFVLSGFLITYIILFEKNSTQQFKLREFFMRRILRIWPLFYAMIGLAWATPYLLNTLGIGYANQGYEPNWWMSVLFLENYQMMALNEFPNVSPLGVMWSLCIEEHFYIIWAVVFSFISVKQTPKLIAICIIVAVLSRFVYGHCNLQFLDVFTNLDYFAYGAIPAYLLVTKKNPFEQTVQAHKFRKYGIVLAALLGSIFFGSESFYGKEYTSPVVLGLLFAALLWYTLPPVNRLYIRKSSWMSILGKYTYGLYLFHTLCIVLVLRFESVLTIFENARIQALWLSVLAFGLSVVVSFLSYHLFEKHFLRLKRFFYS